MNAKTVIKLFSATPFKGRHGDVVIVRDESVESDGKDKSGVLADGEATGHAHRVSRAVVQGVVNSLVQRAITVKRAEKVDHEEHVASPLPKGTYRSGIQAQWTPEGLKRVID
jgi:hypothetical protein